MPWHGYAGDAATDAICLCLGYGMPLARFGILVHAGRGVNAGTLAGALTSLMHIRLYAVVTQAQCCGHRYYVHLVIHQHPTWMLAAPLRHIHFRALAQIKQLRRGIYAGWVADMGISTALCCTIPLFGSFRPLSRCQAD